jgi:hypothetical protein
MLGLIVNFYIPVALLMYSQWRKNRLSITCLKQRCGSGFKKVFGSKIAIYLSLGLLKGRQATGVAFSTEK